MKDFLSIQFNKALLHARNRIYKWKEFENGKIIEKVGRINEVNFGSFLDKDLKINEIEGANPLLAETFPHEDGLYELHFNLENQIPQYYIRWYVTKDIPYGHVYVELVGAFDTNDNIIDAFINKNQDTI